MAWNNLSFMDNTTTLTGVVEGVNNLTDGWLIGALMLAMFIISIMVFYGRVGVGEILLGSGFFFTIISLLFINMGLLPAWIIGVTVGVMVIGVIALFMSG